MRKAVRRSLIVTAALPGLVVIAVLAIWLYVQTDLGLRHVARLAGSLLSGEGQRIDIAALEHVGFWRVEAASLSVSDPAGVWLEIDRMKLDWSWSKILDLSFRPHEIAIATARLSRVPGQGEPEANEPVSLPLLPAAQISIDRLELASAVLGEPVSARIDSAEATIASGDVEIALDVRRLDGGDGTLSLHATYRRAAETVALRAELTEGRVGVLGRLLDAPDMPAYRLTLDGEGPRTAWRGKLEIAAEGQPLGKGDVRLAFDDAVVIGFDGRMHASPLYGDAIERALGTSAHLVFDIEWDRADRLSISRAILNAAGFDFEASGLIALDTKMVDGRATLRTADLAVLPGLEGARINGAGDITLRVAAPLSQPAGDLDVRLTTLQRNEYGVKAIVARGRVEALSPLGDPHPTLRLQLAGVLDGVEGVPARIKPALGERLDWSFDARYGMAGKGLTFDAFDVRAAHARVVGSGTLPPPYDQARSTFRFFIDDLSAFEALAGMPLTGRLEGDVLLVAPLEAGGVSATLVAQSEAFSLGDATFDEILGSKPDLAGQFDLGADGTVRFAALEIRGRSGSLRGEGVYVGASEQVNAGLRLEVPDLGRLSNLIGSPLRGAATLETTLDGTLEVLTATGTLAATGIKAEGATVERLNASFGAADLLNLPKGRLNARFVSEGVETMLDADLAYAKSDTLSITRLKATAADASLTGDLSIGLDDGLVAGKAQARVAAIENWARLFNLDLAGAATLNAEFHTRGGRQSAVLDLAGRGMALTVPDGTLVRARSLNMQARVEDAWGDLQGGATAILSDAESDGVTLTTLAVKVSGAKHAWQAKLSAAGVLDRVFQLEASAAITEDPGGPTIRLDQLEGRYGALPLRLREAATLRLTAGGGALDRLQLVVDKGTIDVAGSVDGARVDATARARGFPLALIRAFVPGFDFDGTARLEATISGDAASPTAHATLEVTDLRPFLPDAPSGTLTARGDLSGGRAAVELALSGLDRTPIAASFAMPMRLSLNPVVLGFDRAAPIEGHATGDIDLALIAPLLRLDEDRLEGHVHVEASLAGSLARPNATGRAVLADGRYENFMTAATLEKIGIEIEGNGNVIALRSLTANGAGGGRLSGSGWMRLDAGKDFPLELALDFNQLWVARLDAISSRASGALKLTGDLQAMALAGSIDVGPADIAIPEQLPPSVTSLDVIEINRPGEPAPTSLEPGAGEAHDRARPFPVALDIQLKAPGRVFVRGRGLDSEWAGTINVRGEIDSPRFDGALRIVRGSFDFLGKRFALREGSIALDEAAPLAPEITMLAEVTGSDITAQARLEGSLKSPVLTLTSVPELPPDEVLSRVLFNKGVGQLSAVEAVQLAESAATLSGQGGTSSILDRLRRTAGFDTLDVGVQGEGASVAAGKYLSEDVLLKVEQGSQPGTSRVGIEVEVTPNVSLETSTGSSDVSEIGVNWKWDY